MLHAPEWIPAWRLKQAYALTEADIVSLVEELGEKGHVSLHAAWDVLQEYFLQPQTKAMPEHWRSIFDDLPVKEDSPSWIVRAFKERDSLYEALRIVSVHADSGKLQGAITTLFHNIYEGEASAISVEALCTPFVIPDNQESSRLFSQIFYESLLFNKYTAVETLERAHYPLIAEVKGITKDFVKTTLTTTERTLTCPLSLVQRSTGSNKDVLRIQTTRQACETVRAEIEQGKHGFLVSGEYKTNWKTFYEAVKSELGLKPHKDTAREEWEKVASNLKHQGRVPEQW